MSKPSLSPLQLRALKQVAAATSAQGATGYWEVWEMPEEIRLVWICEWSVRIAPSEGGLWKQLGGHDLVIRAGVTPPTGFGMRQGGSKKPCFFWAAWRRE